MTEKEMTKNDCFSPTSIAIPHSIYFTFSFLRTSNDRQTALETAGNILLEISPFLQV